MAEPLLNIELTNIFFLNYLLRFLKREDNIISILKVQIPSFWQCFDLWTFCSWDEVATINPWSQLQVY